MSLALANRISFINEELIGHRINTKNQISQTREKEPFCFIDAIFAIKKALEHYNLYELLKKSFINWVVEHTVWQYRTTKNPELKEKIKIKLINEIYPIFGILTKDENYF